MLVGEKDIFEEESKSVVRKLVGEKRLYGEMKKTTLWKEVCGEILAYFQPNKVIPSFGRGSLKKWLTQSPCPGLRTPVFDGSGLKIPIPFPNPALPAFPPFH
ncbi:hypothetical protein Fmac_020913 [Flemingia macrophylla]|uniref:Uncharacterized protein n=1 Tax=Flemingia macrophylla TaxID=520843 RepID=A0ABD1LVI6_9FABA